MKKLVFNLDGLYSIKAGIKSVTRRPVREKTPLYEINDIAICCVFHNDNVTETELVLKIISVTKEKLQDITALELILEGAKTSFDKVWKTLPYETPYTWDENPDVWRIEFERI